MQHDSEFAIAATHPALRGHFPGQPIVPGVLLLAHALEALLAQPVWAARVGAQPRLALVKFQAPVEPGPEATALRVHFDDAGTRVRFEVHDTTHNNRVAASGEWFAVAALQASPS